MYDWKKLAEPFAPFDIEWRIQQSGLKGGKPWGKVLAYVTNRAIMDRLDAVIGPDKWRNTFDKGPEGGVLCGIAINIGDEWVAKFDGAENTDIEAVKGGLSGAMKRAAVHWGIGRYLYNLEGGWARFCEDGMYSAKIDGNWYSWSPPDLPPWALPGGKGEPFGRISAPEPTETERAETRARLNKLDPVTQTIIDTMVGHFDKLGVSMKQLETFLNHGLTVADMTADDMDTLRGIFSEMKGGAGPSRWFPDYFADDIPDGAKIAERVVGATAAIDAALASVRPLDP